jgi:hypothetical protein
MPTKVPDGLTDILWFSFPGLAKCGLNGAKQLFGLLENEVQRPSSATGSKQPRRYRSVAPLAKNGLLSIKMPTCTNTFNNGHA